MNKNFRDKVTEIHSIYEKDYSQEKSILDGYQKMNKMVPRCRHQGTYKCIDAGNKTHWLRYSEVIEVNPEFAKVLDKHVEDGSMLACSDDCKNTTN